MAVASVISECDSTLNIGFLENTDPDLLASRFFPSKVGGHPAWLDLKNLPEVEALNCEKCSKPLGFLLQIYAPLEDNAKCFHRQMYVFMCLDAKCHEGTLAPFKVFRSQLSRENEFYPFEAPIEKADWEPELHAGKYNQLCRACGCRGTKKCSGCGKVNYCSREHQTMDWKFRHKSECKNADFTFKYSENQDAVPSLNLSPFEIVILGDDEEVSDSDDDGGREVDIDKQVEKMRELEKNGGTLSGHDLEEFCSEDDVMKDKNFKRFQKVVKRASDQVIRYQRSEEPLWISDQNVPSDKEIPNCENCGSKRVFEFQIMPQLLYSLKLDKSVKEQSIDWGTLIIYTCEKSCSHKVGYNLEFLWKQIIT